MVARLYTQEDDEKLDLMFKEHDENSPSIMLKSSSGVVSEEDGKIMGCAFLYLTNSPACILDLFGIKKSLDKSKRTEVIDEIIIAVQNMARYYGYKYIVCDPLYKKSEKRLLDHGFIHGNKDVYWYEVI